MSKNIKIFLITFFISLPFWWGFNVLGKGLENFFLCKISGENPNLNLTTQISKALIDYSSFKPIRNQRIEELKIEARSAISVEVTKKNKPRVLFEKASNEKLPIASLTKLMTAYVVLENNHDLSDEVRITQKMVEQEENIGHLKTGEILKIKDLLYMSLMESSNDAAYALTASYDEAKPENFVYLMNLTGKRLGLENTYFVNPTGLDPDTPEEPINYSTSDDLVRFSNYLLEKPLIFDILSTPELDLSPNGVLHHKIENTNELLKEKLNWGPLMVGGKTGWTPEAQGCLLLVLKSPKPGGYLINVILGSEDRFGEMKKLVDWVLEAYHW